MLYYAEVIGYETRGCAVRLWGDASAVVHHPVATPNTWLRFLQSFVVNKLDLWFMWKVCTTGVPAFGISGQFWPYNGRPLSASFWRLVASASHLCQKVWARNPSDAITRSLRWEKGNHPETAWTLSLVCSAVLLTIPHALRNRSDKGWPLWGEERGPCLAMVLTCLNIVLLY